MRIAHASRALVAVLHLAVLFISVSCRVPSNSSFGRVRHSRNLEWSEQLKLREKQLYIMQQSTYENGVERGVECCPSVMEMTEPIAGTNEKGVYVKLYRDEKNHQRFYEISCAEDVENRTCRFVDKKLHTQSKCVQQYSYSYALLEDTNSRDRQNSQQLSITGNATDNARWMLGYIKVRSGCRCMLYKKSKNSKDKRLEHNNDNT